MVFPAPGPPTTRTTLSLGNPPLIISSSPVTPVGTVSDKLVSPLNVKRLRFVFIIYADASTGKKIQRGSLKCKKKRNRGR